ncbi:MAG: LysM peptidoglycan-binding domain-containing protein [Candidatus Eisenbacteria bacterium]
MRKASCPGAGLRASGLHGATAVALVVTLSLSLTGCGTGGLAVKRDVWEASEEFSRGQASLSEKVLYMEGRIAALEEENGALRYQFDQISGQLSGLDTDFSRGLEAVRDGQQQLGIELEDRIRTVDSGRQEDRDDMMRRMEIVLEEVTDENRRLRQDVDALRTSVASMATGYTHEVKSGETLAQIAQQYRVTVADIVQANGISNPNVIPVGKVLTIPAR